ncbi:hypothetical protein OPIT5_18525 [Opitutaceae bacterium TAV5]|nr:hypothetical protein OPIT5_18525 [Opitutaceae bacterium TAV5]
MMKIWEHTCFRSEITDQKRGGGCLLTLADFQMELTHMDTVKIYLMPLTLMA